MLCNRSRANGHVGSSSERLIWREDARDELLIGSEEETVRERKKRDPRRERSTSRNADERAHEKGAGSSVSLGEGRSDPFV